MNVIPLSIDTSELYDLIRKGEVTKEDFEFYMDDLYDEGYSNGRADGESAVVDEAYNDGYEAALVAMEQGIIDE
jgi:hypothetical protein